MTNDIKILNNSIIQITPDEHVGNVRGVYVTIIEYESEALYTKEQHDQTETTFVNALRLEQERVLAEEAVQWNIERSAFIIVIPSCQSISTFNPWGAIIEPLIRANENGDVIVHRKGGWCISAVSHSGVRVAEAFGKQMVVKNPNIDIISECIFDDPAVVSLMGRSNKKIDDYYEFPVVAK